MIKFNQTQLLTFLCFFFILFSPLVRGDCTCEPEDEDRNKPLALKYKMAAIVSILVAGAIGVCFPLLGKTIDALRPEKDIFFVIKAFAAGVILSTGFIHVLPDATENLTSPCLNENPWGKFPHGTRWMHIAGTTQGSICGDYGTVFRIDDAGGNWNRNRNIKYIQ
ncbi:hypothetical protein Goari_000079 [Gossypium aridum]|uniref:Uncharacterized protein n=1 Tax=Gossypium aridum TaxID=34290 RepID=A0A7J8YN75_GOSAI|nr:hypothetical protein [Gossypium aridum]